MRTRYATIKSLFSEALEIPAGSERRAFLREQCEGDETRLKEVQELLAAYEDSQYLLETPAPIAGEIAFDTVMIPEAESPGANLGPYKLLEQIGQGGFGTVFMAEQAVPVRRRVALKILRPGMDSKEVVARFAAERQALALMDHPHIAKVLDAGITTTGRPYFVMELVKGVPITEYCNQVRLNSRERLELFIDVCRAVQHAHLKGVIHRDLKPSNIMVTMCDDRANVKVIDFGIAKAISQPLTDQTLYTGYHQLLGTPLYMSPEQAQMNSMDVDTRSDVYSLGVVLYELLTGSTPFSREMIANANLDELRQIIREHESVRPSQRVSTLGLEAQTTIADQRRIDRRRLGDCLRGDLDWVVMKALEKDRTRRYESASDFAEDIRRYLNNEPVVACPPSKTYRIRKKLRRHRAGIVVSGLFLLLMIAGTGFSTWYALQAEQARKEAEKSERLANDRLVQLQAEQEKLIHAESLTASNYQLAKKAVSQLIDEVARYRMSGVPELASLRDTLLTTADEFYSDLLLQNPLDGDLLIQRGQLRMQMERFADAEQDFLSAAKADPENLYPHLVLTYFYCTGVPHEFLSVPKALDHAKQTVALGPESVEAWTALGWAYFHSGDNAKAVEAMSRAANLQTHPGRRFASMADVKQLEGKFAEAAELLREAILLKIWCRERSLLYVRRAQNLRWADKTQEAIDCLTEGLALSLNVHREDMLRLRSEFSMDLLDHAAAAQDMEQVLATKTGWDDVLPRLLECYLRIPQPDRAVGLLRNRQSVTAEDAMLLHQTHLTLIAQLDHSELNAARDEFVDRVDSHLKAEQRHAERFSFYRRLGKHQLAFEALETQYLQLFAQPPAQAVDIARTERLANDYDALAVTLIRQADRLAESLPAWRRTIELRQFLSRQQPDDLQDRRRLIPPHSGLGWTLFRLGQHVEAEQIFENGLKIIEGIEQQDPEFLIEPASPHWLLNFFEGLASNQLALGRTETAATCFQQGLSLVDREFGKPGRQRIARHFHDCAWTLLTRVAAPLSDPEHALHYATQAVQLESDNRLYLRTLGMAQFESGLPALAIRSLTESQKLDQQKVTEPWSTLYLSMCHAQQGDLEDAERHFQQAHQWLLQRPESGAPLSSVRERGEQMLHNARQKQSSSAGEKKTQPETM